MKSLSLTAKILVLLVILVLGGSASYFLTRPSKPRGYPLVELPPRPVFPDYSGIKVERILQRDERVGEGKTATKNDELKIEQGIWIYDPGAPGNRGKLLSKSEKEIRTVRPSKIKGFKSLHEHILGMREGGTRTFILPANLQKNEEEIQSQLQADSILQITVILVQVKPVK